MAEREDAVLGDHAKTGADAHQTVDRRRQTDGHAGIAAGTAQREIGGDGRTAARGGTTGALRRVVGIADLDGPRRETRGEEGEFVLVGLAEDDRTGCAQAFHALGVDTGLVAEHGVGAGGGGVVEGVEVVFQQDRHAVQIAVAHAAFLLVLGIQCRGLVERRWIDIQRAANGQAAIGLWGVVVAQDAVDVGLHQLDAGELFAVGHPLLASEGVVHIGHRCFYKLELVRCARLAITAAGAEAKARRAGEEEG